MQELVAEHIENLDTAKFFSTLLSSHSVSIF